MLKTALLQCFSERVPLSDHPLVECLEALHRVVVGVFGQILDPETANDISTFEETFMGAMRTHNPRMTPKVHMLIHHVPGYVRRTGNQLGSTSGQVPKRQHTIFDIFYHRFKPNCTNSPDFREHVVFHYNSCHS